MDPARALMLAVLTVAAMATTTAAMAAPAPGPDTTACAEATVRVDAAAQAAVEAGDALAAAETALTDAQAKVEAATETLTGVLGVDPPVEVDVKTASDALLDDVAALAAAADPGPLADALADARKKLADAIAARVEACTEVAVEPTETTTPTSPPPAPPVVFFADCGAVRLADADPLLAGQPGYRAELDADRDGEACESIEGDPDSQVRIKPIGGVATGGWGGPE